MLTKSLIKLTHVNFSYNHHPVLKDVSLEIYRSDFVGIIGPNGSGKTTLIKIMLGLLEPDSGEVQLCNHPLSDFNDWRLIGYVPQKVTSQQLHFPISVSEVVGMGGQNRHDINHALKSVDMTKFKHHLIHELSGGQQQRVFIARALASRPEILILDEPTVGVDTESQTKFYDLLQRLNHEHKLTLVLISHDIDVVAHEVKSVICLNRSIIFHGPPKDVLKTNFFEKLYGQHLRFIVHGH
jgi:zinc transport system ATP-binding protein